VQRGELRKSRLKDLDGDLSWLGFVVRKARRGGGSCVCAELATSGGRGGDHRADRGIMVGPVSFVGWSVSKERTPDRGHNPSLKRKDVSVKSGHTASAKRLLGKSNVCVAGGGKSRERTA